MTVPTNFTGVAQLARVLDVEFVNKFNGGIGKLLDILGNIEVETMAPGTQIKVYKTSGTLQAGSGIDEGDTIPLSQYKNELKATYALDFSKWRKATSVESVAKRGYDQAVAKTDEKMIQDVQKGIRTAIFTMLATGTGAIDSGASPNGIQSALAYAWAALQEAYEDEQATPLYFVNSLDIADHLASKTLTLESAFGFSYIENFLGLGTVIVDSNVAAGSLYATAKENLNIYCADLGGLEGFEFYSDESGLIGVHHDPTYSNASLETVAISGLKMFPEFTDGIIKIASF